MEQAKTVRWTIWATMLVAVCIYAALPLLFTPTRAPADAPQLLVSLLAAAALASGAASFVTSRVLLRAPLAAGDIDPSEPEGAQRVLAAYLVTWVLAETPGLLGFVAYMLTQQMQITWVLAATSLALLVAHAPRDAHLAAATPTRGLGHRPDPIG